MCGFGVTNLSRLADVNKSCQRRGPDMTTVETRHGITFLHNLLHITGDVRPQPMEHGDVVCVFNGEIYNYQDFGSYVSDGECILPIYVQHGVDFARHLDGEFAVCIVDFGRRRIVMATDTFACKPLWYSMQPGAWCVASYQSQIQGLGLTHARKLAANTTVVFDLDTLTQTQQVTNHEFDLRQHRTSFDAWVEAFEHSINKRTKNTQHGMFVGMSSGYDSGAIACELDRQAVPFKAYSIVNNENMTVLSERLTRLLHTEAYEMTAKDVEQSQQDLKSCEDFVYDDGFRRYDIKQDQASLGLASICRRARQEQRRVYFSGQGADEIISDYGFAGRKIFKHSGFGGMFPESLQGFFPWHSFWDGTQIQYLNKEEYVAGHYGIETRYPFLDRDLVQEFLWLTAGLKNSRYKSCLDHYLQSRQWPYHQGEKLGFHVAKRKSKK
jgi:asparagine synthetase B (glutamine-hydrolysing)